MNTLRSAICKLELKNLGRNSILFYREEIHLKIWAEWAQSLDSLVLPTTKIIYIYRFPKFIKWLIYIIYLILTNSL